MTGWFWFLASTVVYLAGGLTAARIAFVGELGDSPRLERDYCSEQYCTHFITMVDGERYQTTKAYDTARAVAGWIFVGWPGIVALLILAAPFIGVWVAFDRVIGRLTEAEKLTQHQRELAALSTRAGELGLPVPEEWGQDSGRNDDPYGDKAWIKAEVERRAKLRNPNRHREEHAA